MELRAVLFSFYDDKWMDGYGLVVLESDIPGIGSVQEIGPLCEPSLAPCFDAFTPVTMKLTGDSMGAPPNLFVLSSKGGLLEFPSWSGSHSIEFAGSLWEELASLQVGFYLPDACGDAEPPEGIECSFYQEWGLTVDSLTFRPVPEPAALALLASGMLGWIVQRRAAARRP